jgi:hypothetical protein
MEICCWTERRGIGQRERRQEQRANQEAGSKAGRGNGWKDMKLVEKCWTYFDARRGILRQRKKSRQYQGAKQEARTDGLKRDSA